VGPDVFLSGPGGVLPSGFAAAKAKAQSFYFCRVGDAEEEPFRLAALGTFSQGISDLHDFIEDRYEIGALLTLAGTAL
jgi:hypothetical protein